MEKYFLEIINLLIENNTEQIYRKIMLSILDIIIENPILCISINNLMLIVQKIIGDIMMKLLIT
jgi:hypothetical protein